MLLHLLTLSSELSGTVFDQKLCFYQVKLDGKAKWECPKEKTKEGLWDLGVDPKGIL